MKQVEKSNLYIPLLSHDQENYPELVKKQTFEGAGLDIFEHV